MSNQSSSTVNCRECGSFCTKETDGGGKTYWSCPNCEYKKLAT